MLSTLGISTNLTNLLQLSSAEWDRSVRAALQHRDEQRWYEEIRSDDRMRTLASLYSPLPQHRNQSQSDAASSVSAVSISHRAIIASTNLKNVWKMEEYLLTSDIYTRKQLTKLRYGGQQLRISQGRYKRLQRHERCCLVCGEDVIEDERHLICDCPIYELERNKLTSQLNTIGLYNSCFDFDDELFNVVMGVYAPSTLSSASTSIGMPLTQKQRVMVYMYCRQFVTKALHRRNRCLADRERAESERSRAESHNCDPSANTNAVDVIDVADSEEADFDDL